MSGWGKAHQKANWVRTSVSAPAPRLAVTVTARGFGRRSPRRGTHRGSTSPHGRTSPSVSSASSSPPTQSPTTYTAPQPVKPIASYPASVYPAVKPAASSRRQTPDGRVTSTAAWAARTAQRGGGGSLLSSCVVVMCTIVSVCRLPGVAPQSQSRSHPRNEPPYLRLPRADEGRRPAGHKRIHEDSRRRLGKHFAVYIRLYPPVHVDLYADD